MANALFDSKTQKFNLREIMIAAWDIFKHTPSCIRERYLRSGELPGMRGMRFRASLRMAWNLAIKERDATVFSEPVKVAATPFDTDIQYAKLDIDCFDRSCGTNYRHPEMKAKQANLAALEAQAAEYREAA